MKPVFATVAHRYSGDLRIRITLLEPWGAGTAPPAGFTSARDGEYRCFIRPRPFNAYRGCTIYVRPPACLEHAVDSSEAFDNAAHAALAFAADEGWPVDTYAASNEDGYLIERRKPKHWVIAETQHMLCEEYAKHLDREIARKNKERGNA